MKTAVNLKEMFQGMGFQLILIPPVFERRDNLAKLLAPIPQMVEPNNLVALALINPADGMTDNRGSEVAHVKRFGNVGRRKFNQNGFPLAA